MGKLGVAFAALEVLKQGLKQMSSIAYRYLNYTFESACKSNMIERAFIANNSFRSLIGLLPQVSAEVLDEYCPQPG